MRVFGKCLYPSHFVLSSTLRRRGASGEDAGEEVDVALGPPVAVAGLDIEAQAACH